MTKPSPYSELHRAYLQGKRAGRLGLIENPYPKPLHRGSRSFSPRQSWERSRMATTKKR